MIKIAVIDDQPIILDGFGSILKKMASKIDIKLIFTATNGQYLIDYLEINGEDSIDIAILDFKMPGMNGIELVKYLKQKFPSIKSVLFSSYYEVPMIEGAMLHGASSFLEKNMRYKDLMFALNQIHETGYYFPDGFPHHIIKSLVEGEKIKPTHDFTAVVSDRCKEVAILIAKGFSYKDIADQLKPALCNRVSLFEIIA